MFPLERTERQRHMAQGNRPKSTAVKTASIICHVMDYGGASPGSFIPAIAALARAVRARGDRFIVFTTDIPGATWYDQLRGAGCELHLLKSKRDLIAGLHATRPDVVHSHFTRYDVASLEASSETRLFWHVHSYSERNIPVRARALMKYRLLGNRVEALLAVSHEMAQELRKYWYGQPNRVRIIQNGVDTEYFRRPAPDERARARSKLGIDADDRVVLFFERIPLKGGSTVREALALNANFRLLVVGGSREDRERFGSSPRVLSIEYTKDVRQLYWAADVLAFASDREGMPFVILEAMACGLPIAASDLPVVREISGEVPSVVRFPVRDSRSLANALENAMSTAPAEAGRARIVEQFSLNKWTEEILKLYDRQL